MTLVGNLAQLAPSRDALHLDMDRDDPRMTIIDSKDANPCAAVLMCFSLLLLR